MVLAKRPLWSASLGCALQMRDQFMGNGPSPQKDRNKIRELVGAQLQWSALPPRPQVGEAVRLFASFDPNPLQSRNQVASEASLGIK